MAWLLRKGTQDLPLLESRLVHYRDNRSRVENVVERGERGGGGVGGLDGGGHLLLRVWYFNDVTGVQACELKKYHKRFFFCRVLVFSDWVIDWNLHVSCLIGALIIVSQVKLIHNAAEELQFSIEAREDHNNERFLSCFSAPVSLNYKGLLRIEMIQEKNNKLQIDPNKFVY